MRRAVTCGELEVGGHTYLQGLDSIESSGNSGRVQEFDKFMRAHFRGGFRGRRALECGRFFVCSEAFVKVLPDLSDVS